MAINLPDESRTSRLQRNDKLSLDQHLAMSIIDGLNKLLYEASISAGAAAGKQYRELIRTRPKPIERPVYVKPEVVFSTVKDLRNMLGM